MKLIIRLIISTVAVLIADYLIPGVNVDDYVTAFIVAIVLGILNTILKPVLVLLTLPVTVVTLGLFYFVLNALMVWIASQLVPGFVVMNILSALLFSIVVSLINSFLSSLSK
jgi:putative membrane protein